MKKPSKPLLINIAMYAGAIVAIVAVFPALGWDSPPWAATKRLTEMAQNFQALQSTNSQQMQNAQVQYRSMLLNQLPLWQWQREQARLAVRRNPNDMAARQYYDFANTQVHGIESQLGLPPS